MKYKLKFIVFIFVQLVTTGAYAFEPIGTFNHEWFSRCEINQPGFDLDSIYNDHIAHWYPNQYQSMKDNKVAKKQIIDEIRSFYRNVSICHPKMTFSFRLDLPKFDSSRHQIEVEKIEKYQLISYYNTIYSNLPSEFHMEIKELLVPEFIKMGKADLKMLSMRCNGLFIDKPSSAVFNLNVNIERVSLGHYSAKPTSGEIVADCPNAFKGREMLVEFKYKNG